MIMTGTASAVVPPASLPVVGCRNLCTWVRNCHLSLCSSRTDLQLVSGSVNRVGEEEPSIFQCSGSIDEEDVEEASDRFSSLSSFKPQNAAAVAQAVTGAHNNYSEELTWSRIVVTANNAAIYRVHAPCLVHATNSHWVTTDQRALRATVC